MKNINNGENIKMPTAPRLKPIDKNMPVIPMRSCNHPGGWTLDLIEMKRDGTGIVTSYCAGCIIAKLRLKPVAKHKIIIDQQHPEGKLVKIWERQ